jgi:regulator of RNase E activity RraA
VTDEVLFEMLRGVSVDSAWSVLSGLGFSDTFVQGLTCLHPDKRMVGRAITMKYLPMRGDLVESLRIRERGMGNNVGPKNAKPHDVLVIDACGISNGGAFGDILVAGFQANGGTGIVIYGAMRDLSALRQMHVPIYYTATHAAGSRGMMCVDFNVPVNCAGVAVVPGDILLGDVEGVLVIPAHLAEEVATKGKALEEKELFIRRKLESGEAKVEEAYPMSARLQAEYTASKKHS